MSSRCVLQWILVPSIADANVLYNRTKWTVPNNEVYFLCLIILPYSHSLYHRLSRNGMVYTAETDVATAQMNVQWASVMGHRLPSRQSNSLLGSTGFFQSADISTVEEVPLSRKKIAIRMGWELGWDTPKYNRIRLKFQMSARHSSLFVFWLLQLLHLILINSQCNMARDGTVQ